MPLGLPHGGIYGRLRINQLGKMQPDTTKKHVQQLMDAGLIHMTMPDRHILLSKCGDTPVLICNHLYHLITAIS